jgi:hypothetical protein
MYAIEKLGIQTVDLIQESIMKDRFNDDLIKKMKINKEEEEL